MTRMSKFSATAGWLLVVAIFAGCEFQPPAAGPALPTKPIAASSPGIDPKLLDDADVWMVCHIGGAKVGYMHTQVTTSGPSPTGQRIYTYDDRLSFKRFGQTATIQTHLSCTESLDGQLREFESVLKTGPDPVVTKGRVRGGQLILETTTAGKTTTAAAAWDAAWGGFFADKQSLQQRPLKPGESRRVTALLPVVNQAGEIQMKAGGYEAVALLGETRRLLRVDVATRIGPTVLKSIVWIDESGREWKIRDQQLGMEAFRTTREVAEKSETAAAFDIGESTLVRVQRRLDQPQTTRRIVYRAKLREGDPRKLFASGGSQTVSAIDAATVAIDVRAIRPDDPKEMNVPESAKPTADDSAASNMIQSDDPRVVALAGSIAAGETNAWQIACALEKLVREKIKLKNYSTAMATAADVVESLEGDCTEHSVLLAALCRARKIPARVAIGLVYVPAEQAYAYHMWTEVWIRDRWIGLDGTLGRGGIGADHLKLLDTPLAGSSGLAEILPIIQALGNLELEILEVE